MKKIGTQSAFPILLACVFILVFVPSASGLFHSIGNLITELTNMKTSSLEGVSSGIYVTPDDELENCDWRYGFPHKMHWPQLPDFGQTGMDVDFSKAILADDFKCTSTGPITDIHFWASFIDDIQPVNEPNHLTFEIKIYSDIPANADSWSMPGNELWSQTFYPGDYTVREIKNRPSDWYDPISLYNKPNDHRLAFQYNFCVEKNPFIQEEGTIYWLSIRDIRAANDIHKLGWKTTTKKLRWNDGAVFSLPGASGWLPMRYPKEHKFVGESINFAFSITDGMQGDRLHDLGDAPDSSNTFTTAKMLAYTDPNVQANYPTIFWTYFPPYGPIHWQPEKKFYLGKDVSFESGADTGYDEDTNNNLYPPSDLSNRDGADDGIKLPLVLPHCQEAKIPFTLTTISPAVTSPIYLNVWCDWNRDGDWDDIIECIDGTTIPEWAVQNTPITINYAGTASLDSPPFMCWNPQTDNNEPDPMWLRISVAEKQWSTSYPTLTGHGGSGPDEGYEYGETEDYLVYAKEDPTETEYDWADSPDSVMAPAYPTMSSNNGAYHVIAGPWFGDANDKPDAEIEGQPDPNALGDDLDTTTPLFSTHPPNDDENGVTIPPLIPGYPADVTLEVGGGGGIVQAWIDYDSNMIWTPDEEVYNGFLAQGSHVISFIVPIDAVPGQSFARFRISRKGNLGPDGPAKDGEVEDYEVVIESLSPYTKWLQLPDVTPHGIDIRVDSNEGLRIIADDFQCTSKNKITDVHFWGSWKQDKKYDILRINLSIYDDDPSTSDNSYSKPKANILWQKDFYQGQFKEKLYHVVRKPGEWWWDPAKDEIKGGADRQIWKIDIDINPDEAFLQKGTIENPRIYWLAIRVDTNDGEFGWKTRRWPDHFMDDAVWDVGSELPRLWKELRYPKKHPYYDIERNSIDMAFQLTHTQDPGLPTMRPVVLTQCSAVQTKCPTQVTTCPPVNTRCPAVATNCPPVQTQCMAITVCQGSSETICPAVLTECPVVETTCPFVETQCYAITVCQGSSETICPAVYTHCPVVETTCPTSDTKCPTVETQCPVIETQCPFVETQCYAITVCGGSSETICPAVYTQCPVVETECPPTVTQCVAITVCQGSSETICPAVNTQCPEEPTRCPPVETQCPPEPTLCQVIATQCPVDTICPASETRCPVVATECPVTETRCPVSMTICPPLETECPVVETTCPFVETQCYAITVCQGSSETICPAVYTRCPVVETECPPSDTVCPPMDTECPVVETQCPFVETQCYAITVCGGSSETICPAVYTYCPVIDTECPPYETACPPTNTRCPVEPTRCPPVETQCPPEPTLCQVIATQCPVETVCPVSETKCPAQKTVCPTTATFCPTYDTRCPVIDTQCPVQQTVCPTTDTQCPPTETQCPPVKTQCPTINTECPQTETQCPPSETKCPDCVQTVYPAVETRCPAVRTQCPQVTTECPPDQCYETVYPVIETKCPVEITKCPVYNTWCNDVPTECPYNQTQCPPPNPTGSCDPPPIPPWEGGVTTGMIYSDQTINKAKKTVIVPAIQSCPAIEVKCPTIIEDAKLLVSAK
ncbi:MAG: hypothetical protein JXA96_07680 [Sedimentisphaerales bacterium]|nr:hypothetical protein [Sedimentisphaerales bacterium]